jgi:hypothetical protein
MDLFWLGGLAGSAFFSWLFTHLYYKRALRNQAVESAKQLAELTALRQQSQESDQQMLRLQQARDRAIQEAAELSRRQRHLDLSALSQQVYERAARFFREMPDEDVGGWFDWVNLFEGTGAAELRALFLTLQQRASAAGGENAEAGRLAHSSFLSLERTAHDIYNTDWGNRSPEDLVADALSSREAIRDALERLGARVDRSQRF